MRSSAINKSPLTKTRTKRRYQRTRRKHYKISTHLATPRRTTTRRNKQPFDSHDHHAESPNHWPEGTAPKVEKKQEKNYRFTSSRPERCLRRLFLLLFVREHIRQRERERARARVQVPIRVPTRNAIEYAPTFSNDVCVHGNVYLQIRVLPVVNNNRGLKRAAAVCTGGHLRARAIRG